LSNLDLTTDVPSLAPSLRATKRAFCNALIGFIFCIGLVAPQWSLSAPTTAVSTFDEYNLKAVFLFRFAQFVDWPAADEEKAQPFPICIVGRDPFKNYLEDAVRGESFHDRAFVVRQLRSSDALDQCRILFISSSEAHRVRQILDGVKGRNILTVSDIDNFAESGGIVEFVTAEKRIRLKINVDAARAANLTISSKLLRPAVIVMAERAG
jgi:hypothetical protein